MQEETKNTESLHDSSILEVGDKLPSMPCPLVPFCRTSAHGLSMSVAPLRYWSTAEVPPLWSSSAGAVGPIPADDCIGSTAYTQNLLFFFPATASTTVSVGLIAAAPFILSFIPLPPEGTIGDTTSTELAVLSTVRARLGGGPSSWLSDGAPSLADLRSPRHSPHSSMVRGTLPFGFFAREERLLPSVVIRRLVEGPSDWKSSSPRWSSSSSSSWYLYSSWSS